MSCQRQLKTKKYTIILFSVKDIYLSWSDVILYEDVGVAQSLEYELKGHLGIPVNITIIVIFVITIITMMLKRPWSPGCDRLCKPK